MLLLWLWWQQQQEQQQPAAGLWSSGEMPAQEPARGASEIAGGASAQRPTTSLKVRLQLEGIGGGGSVVARRRREVDVPFIDGKRQKLRAELLFSLFQGCAGDHRLSARTGTTPRGRGVCPRAEISVGAHRRWRNKDAVGGLRRRFWGWSGGRKFGPQRIGARQKAGPIYGKKSTL